MKNTQDPTWRKDNYREDDVYENMEELTKAKDEAPTTEEASTSKILKARIILAALILLIILFLILIAITGLLLKYYLDMSNEMSHLKNHENVQEHFLQDVKAINKTLENIQEHFLQDIKAINKTLETICRTCPSGWQPIGLFCYFFSSDVMTWDNARNECIRKGSALVSIKSQEELDILKSFLEQNSYWIALRRDKAPGKWKWLDGSMLSFSHWNKGEPSNHNNNEDCVESYYVYWNDLSCARTVKYACKKGCCC